MCIYTLKGVFMKSYLLVLVVSIVTLFTFLSCGGGGGSSDSPIYSSISAPQNFVAIPADGQATLSWDSVDSATSYNLYWSVISSFTQSTGTKIANVSSPYLYQAMANGLTYYFIVTAVGPSGESAASEKISVTPFAATSVPTVPTNVSATAGETQNSISWSGVSGATSYNLYWSNSTGVTTADTKIANIAAPYIHTGLTNGTPYYYGVTAVNTIGEGVISGEVSATPTVPSTIPSAPSGLVVTAGSGSVVLNWSSVAEASSYNAYYSATTGVTKDNGIKIPNVTSPYTISSLVNNTPYYFIITAQNSVGESADSSQASATPVATVQNGAWAAMGSGLSSPVNDFVYTNGTLYAASYGVASWNGTTWTDMSTGLNALFGSGDVYALATYGSDLFAGGQFTVYTPSLNWYNNAARYTGTSWTTCGSGTGSDGSGMSDQVNFMLEYNGQLYAGGKFTTAGGDPLNQTVANYIASFDGSIWHQVGGGVDNYINDMIVYNNKLIVAGSFTQANYLTPSGDAYSSSPVSVNYIAQWDGANWTPLGVGMDGKVTALAIHNGLLYAGGQFSNAGGVAAKNIASWNGTSWSAVGTGITNQVYTLASYLGKLYAGGASSMIGSTTGYYLQRWDGAQWSGVDGGTDGAVYVLVPDNTGGLLVGGSFTTAGTISATNVARYIVP
jgi:hypothetical protein